jgi:hypothetical protein
MAADGAVAMARIPARRSNTVSLIAPDSEVSVSRTEETLRRIAEAEAIIRNEVAAESKAGRPVVGALAVEVVRVMSLALDALGNQRNRYQAVADVLRTEAELEIARQRRHDGR